jgi:hypothetical protein
MVEMAVPGVFKELEHGPDIEVVDFSDVKILHGHPGEKSGQLPKESK